jgi:ATP-binding protein involved in chromosome partitioning
MGGPFLGEIPSEPLIRIRGDEGKVSALFSEENPVRQPLIDISSNVAVQIAKQILEGPALPTLELL